MIKVEVSLKTNRIDIIKKICYDINSIYLAHMGTSEILMALVTGLTRTKPLIDASIRSMLRDLGIYKEKSLDLTTCLNTFVHHKKMQRRSASQIRNVAKSVKEFVILMGNMSLPTITNDDCILFINKITAARRAWTKKGKYVISDNDKSRVSISTVHRKGTDLLSFFNWAVEKEWIAKSPLKFNDIPAPNRKKKFPPPPELLPALCSIPYPGNTQLSAIEWYALCYFFYFTGGRRSEVCGIRRDDIKMQAGVLCIHMRNLKRGASSDEKEYKIIPIHWLLLPIVKYLLESHASEWLFPTVGHEPTADEFGETEPHGHLYSSLFIPRAKNIWPQMVVHTWRHRFMTTIRESGVSDSITAKMTGHTVGNILDVYTKRNMQRMLQDVNELPNPTHPALPIDNFLSLLRTGLPATPQSNPPAPTALPPANGAGDSAQQLAIPSHEAGPASAKDDSLR